MRHRDFNAILRFLESSVAKTPGRTAAEVEGCSAEAEYQADLSEEILRCARGELDQTELVSLCQIIERRPDLIETLAQGIHKHRPQKRPARRELKNPQP